MSTPIPRRVAAGLLALPGLAMALPAVQGTQAYTELIGPNPLIRPGYFLVVGATGITPSGAGTTVAALHTPPDPALDYAVPATPSPLFPNSYFAFVPYAGQGGAWEIRATDASGSASATTHLLDDVRQLPLIGGLTLGGAELTPTIGWDRLDPALYPSGCTSCTLGFDFFNYGVIVRNASGGLIYQSGVIPNTPATPTSWTLPAGLLAPGQDYLLGVRLNQSELEVINPNGSFVSPLENRSTAYIAYSTPVPEPAAPWMALAGLGVLRLASALRRRRGGGVQGPA